MYACVFVCNHLATKVFIGQLLWDKVGCCVLCTPVNVMICVCTCVYKGVVTRRAEGVNHPLPIILTKLKLLYYNMEETKIKEKTCSAGVLLNHIKKVIYTPGVCVHVCVYIYA